jgi:hypothetical protein
MQPVIGFHDSIGDHKVDAEISNLRNAVLAIPTIVDVNHPESLEDRADQFPHVLVVVNDQNRKSL